VGAVRKTEIERERGGGHPTHVANMRSRAIHDRFLSVWRAARAIPHIFVFPICK